MADIFLCYAYQDRERVHRLVQALEAQGWTVFWSRDVTPKEEFRHAMKRELAAAACVIAVWSKNSVTSDWVTGQAEEGKGRDVLMSILLDEVDLPLDFRQVNPAKLTGWNGDKEDPRVSLFLRGVHEFLASVRGANPAKSLFEQPIVAACSSENAQGLISGPSLRKLQREPTAESLSNELRKLLEKPIKREGESAQSDISSLVEKIIEKACPSDRVHFSVSAPAAARLGRTIILDVWTHLEGQRDEVLRRIKQASVDNEAVRVRQKGPFKIGRGARLAVRVRFDAFVVEPQEEVVSWEGEIANASFEIGIPESTAEGTRVGIVTVHYEGGPQIARLPLEIAVTNGVASEVRSTHRLEPIRTAFASYASRDRDEVLGRIQGMQKILPDLEVFLDVVNLRSGEDWENRLWKVIPENDIFYLFWSAAAKESSWVEKEWRCALKTRGENFIDPVPLVSPEEVRPPEELSKKHFNDWVLAYRTGKQSSRGP